MRIYESSYRVIMAQWGIAIDISGEIASYSDYDDKVSCRKIDDGLWLKIANHMSHEESEYMYTGLKKNSDSIKAISPFKCNTLIIFHEIKYNLCDYQPEGLIPAVYKWISEAFKIDTPIVEVSYNRAINKYKFSCSE
jgi:hypothetical protein